MGVLNDWRCERNETVGGFAKKKTRWATQIPLNQSHSVVLAKAAFQQIFITFAAKARI